MIGNKGASETAIDWFVAMMFTILIIIMLLIITSAYKSRVIDTSQVDPEIYVSKLYFSQEILKPEAIPLQFGVIAESQFTSENLNVQNEYAEEQIGSRLTLLDSGGKKTKGPIFNNEQFFNASYPLAVNNAGGYHYKNFTYPVMIERGSQLAPGYLVIEVVS